MNSINISVIIPVYNADKFIQKAIESAVNQEFVSEVVVVNDNSTDNSVDIILELQKRYPIIRLIEHEFDSNLGAGQARNIGVISAKNDWLAFLDVDDYYYENRFQNILEVLKSYPNADGVYEAVENVFENNEAYTRFMATRPRFIAGNKTDYKHTLFTMYKAVEPSRLFNALLEGDKGFFHFNGLLVKKNLVLKVGMLNSELELFQDIDLFMKLAMIGELHPGQLEKPVAARMVHSNNRVYGNNVKLKYYRLKSLSQLEAFAIKMLANKEVINIIEMNNIKTCSSELMNWNIYQFFRLKHAIIKRIYRKKFKQFLEKEKAINNFN